jgi:hypothetical protein
MQLCCAYISLCGLIRCSWRKGGVLVWHLCISHPSSIEVWLTFSVHIIKLSSVGVVLYTVRFWILSSLPAAWCVTEWGILWYFYEIWCLIFIIAIRCCSVGSWLNWLSLVLVLFTGLLLWFQRMMLYLICGDFWNTVCHMTYTSVAINPKTFVEVINMKQLFWGLVKQTVSQGQSFM